MESERQHFLEALASASDRDDMLRHQAIANYLGSFMDRYGLQQDLTQARAAVGSDVAEPEPGANDYMETDSDSDSDGAVDTSA